MARSENDYIRAYELYKRSAGIHSYHEFRKWIPTAPPETQDLFFLGLPQVEPIVLEEEAGFDLAFKTPKIEILDDDRVTFSSGATSSQQELRHDLVPICAVRRLAQRYTMGAAKHGDYNYRTGLGDEAFVRDRMNHITEHWQKFLLYGSAVDDNLAAVMWGISILMEMETTIEGHQLLAKIRSEAR